MTNHTPTEGQMLTAWLIASGADRMRGDHQERFQAEFDRFIATVRADAWDEGNRWGFERHCSFGEECFDDADDNPYRQEDER